MAELIAKSGLTAVVGLGATGLSVARFLARERRPFVLMDTREAPPQLAAVREAFPSAQLHLGSLSAEVLNQVDEIVLSPGLPMSEPAIAAARERGVPVIGDIELFARHARAPIVAITGSNAKSTVTRLLGDMAEAAGRAVGVGGNIGTPALDLLRSPADLYVLELSSFQLETTEKLGARAACILNVSADHLDRYGDMSAYHAAKQRIYFGAEQVVVNRDDPLTRAPLAEGVTEWSFGLDRPDRHGFGVIEEDGRQWLAFEWHAWMAVDELAMAGRHNLANALAALALGHAAGLPKAPMLETLRRFQGLPHRCQTVAELAQVRFVNDSKGTNVGATLAALRGLHREPNKLVLIAGGDGKGADFTPLAGAARETLRAAVLIGRDAGALEEALGGKTRCVHAGDMEAAVRKAFAHARAGDTVLLSPACGSQDMFADFRARGEAFADAVQLLVREVQP